jgi:hypothetical protein
MVCICASTPTDGAEAQHRPVEWISPGSGVRAGAGAVVTGRFAAFAAGRVCYRPAASAAKDAPSGLAAGRGPAPSGGRGEDVRLVLSLLARDRGAAGTERKTGSDRRPACGRGAVGAAQEGPAPRDLLQALHCAGAVRGAQARRKGTAHGRAGSRQSGCEFSLS